MMTKDNLRKLTGDERLGQMRDSEYLGAEDIDDDVEPVLTIDALWNGMVTLQRGKENKDVLSFKEERVPGIMQVRPLIINSTNRKTLRKLFGDEAVRWFCICNAYKYRFRDGSKPGVAAEQDEKKARWYEDYAVKMMNEQRYY